MIVQRARRAACALLAAVAFNLLVFGALGALNHGRRLPEVVGGSARLSLVEPPPVRPKPPEPPRPVEPEPPPPETLPAEPGELAVPAVDLAPLDLPLVAPDVTVPALRIAPPVVAPRPRRARPVRRRPRRPAVRHEPRTTFGSDEVDTPPRDLETRKPAYPAYARRRGLEGWVTLKLLIDGQGRVQEVEVVDVTGFAGFRHAVLDVVPRWRFTPPRHRGRGVKVWAVRTVRFRLVGPGG
ncbi:MAG: energy transducer TonB [Planctomycetota bacterium]